MLNIFKASAGSGKTFTLAKEYITMLLAIKDPERGTYVLNLDDTRSRLLVPYPHRAILAITFTRKATEEMKRRIIKELALLARLPEGDQKESVYAPMMVDEFRFKGAKCSRSDLAITAKLALQQLLFDYQNFNISTIDAFFQRVMHTFARELGQQSDYALELDSEAAMRNAVGIMLDEFNTQPQENEPLEAWLLEFMRKQIDQGKRANFFNRRSGTHTGLVKLISNITLESFKPFEAQTMEYLDVEGKNGGNQLKEFTDKIAHEQNQILNDMQGRAIALEATGVIESLPSNSKFRTSLPTLVKGKPLSDFTMYDTIFGRAILAGELNGKAGNKKIKPEDERPIQEFYLYVYQQYQRYNLLSDISECLSQLGLLKHAWSYLDQFNRDNNTVLLAQTNSLVSQIIDKDKDNSPFVYERMGVKLHHFLIDEFQDTSSLQWENLWPLVLNAIGEGQDSLVIGDEKQSIYRWRNSDSEILHTGIEAQVAQAHQEYHILGGRTTNYRSAHPIVRFNNTLFTHLAKVKSIPGFDQVVQQLNPSLKDLPGYVKFTPLPDEGEEETLRLMVVEMQRQHDNGYQWRDIAILTRRNQEAALVVDYLAKNHPEINVLSEDALKVGSSNAVQLVLNTLRIIDQQQQLQAEESQTGKENQGNEKKYPSKAEVILSIHRFGLCLNRLFEEARHKNKPLSSEDMSAITLKALDQALSTDADDGIVDDVERVREKKPTTLVAMVETIIGNQFSPEERKRQFTYLSAFQDLVIDFCAQNQGSVHAFLDWWDVKGCKQNVSGAADANAVQVLTVHKAKGLEFPCVHIPFCTWKLYGNRNSTLWTSFPSIEGIEEDNTPPALYVTMKGAYKESDHPFEADYRQEHEKLKIDTANMTYVAFTRAINELMVWYGNPRKSASSNDGDEPDNPPIFDLLCGAFAMPDVDVEAEPDLLIDMSAYYRDMVFAYGEPTAKVRKAKAQDPDQIPTERLQLADPYPVHFPTHASSLIALADVLDDFKDVDDNPASQPIKELAPALPDKQKEKAEEAQEMGNVMHSIMAHIIEATDLDQAVIHAANRWKLDPGTASKYKARIRKFLNTPDERIARWFAHGADVYIEQPIYGPGQQGLRYPDRVVVDPATGQADVIDYKFTWSTGQLELPEYRAQVRGYMKLLKKMGYRNVRGFLCSPLLPNDIKEVK